MDQVSVGRAPQRFIIARDKYLPWLSTSIHWRGLAGAESASLGKR